MLFDFKMLFDFNMFFERVLIFFLFHCILCLVILIGKCTALTHGSPCDCAYCYDSDLDSDLDSDSDSDSDSDMIIKTEYVYVSK